MKLKITNGQQFKLLVAEIKKNPSLAKGCQRGVNPTNFNQQWEDVTNLLNAHGPPLRDSDGWQRVITITPTTTELKNYGFSGVERLKI